MKLDPQNGMHKSLVCRNRCEWKNKMWNKKDAKEKEKRQRKKDARGGKKDVKEKICISKNTQKEKKYAKEKKRG